MAQLMINTDVNEIPSLRKHIATQVDDIESKLPHGSPLIVQIKRISKNLFDACFRVRLLGKELIFSVQSANPFSAVSEARRGLLRQVCDVKSFSRQLARHRVR